MNNRQRQGRRRLLQGAGAAALVPAVLRAWAQPGFPAPGRPIRIVVPAPAGGPADTIARALARQLGLQLNQAPVVVDNRPGGASIPAATEVARAAPDGHTLFLGLNTTHTQVPHLFGKLPYDPFKDFTPVTQVYKSSSILVAHPSVPVADLREAVALSKREPGIPFGSAGPGTSGHLYLEFLNANYGARFSHVPYKGAADASRDLVGGFIKLQFDSPTNALPLLKARRLKALAVAGGSRTEALPEVRTMTEQGFAGLDARDWMGVYGPGGLPADTLATLNREFVKAIRSPEVQAQFAPLGVELTGTPAAEFREVVAADYQSWGKVIKQIGIKLD